MTSVVACRPQPSREPCQHRIAEKAHAYCPAIAHGHGSHDRTLGEMSVPHDPPPTILGRAIGVAGKELRYLGLDRSRKQRTRALTQNFGERIREAPWMGKLENIIGSGRPGELWRHTRPIMTNRRLRRPNAMFRCCANLADFVLPSQLTA